MVEKPNEIPIACRPAAIPPASRDRWMAVGKKVYAAIEEVRELDDGWSCRLPGDTATLLDVAEYLSLDRLCCPFVRWTLRVGSSDEFLWLDMQGPEGTKALGRATFETTDLLTPNVAEAAGFSVHARVAVGSQTLPHVVEAVNAAARRASSSEAKG